MVFDGKVCTPSSTVPRRVFNPTLYPWCFLTSVMRCLAKWDRYKGKQEMVGWLLGAGIKIRLTNNSREYESETLPGQLLI